LKFIVLALKIADLALKLLVLELSLNGIKNRSLHSMNTYRLRLLLQHTNTLVGFGVSLKRKLMKGRKR
jgi:hypothetical protein